MRLAYFHYLVGHDTALNHVRQFSQAVETLGHQIDVYPMNLSSRNSDSRSRPSGFQYARRMAKSRFSRYLHEPKELLWNPIYVRKETNLLRRNRPDVILVRDHLLTSSCVLAARRVDVPLVLEINAPAAESRQYLDQYMHLPLIPEWLERLKLSYADAVVTVSTALKDHLVALHDLQGEKFSVVHNGADLDTFKPETRRDEGVPKGFRTSPVLGFVGSLKKWHNPQALIDLIAGVGQKRPDLHFLLVGADQDSWVAAQLRTQFGSRFFNAGKVSHERVPGLIACFDIAVLPETAFYCSPLKVFEYMAAGKAVVAPGYAPLREIIVDGEHGLLFEPGDYDQFQNLVLSLTDSPDLRASLGQAAFSRVKAQFSWDHNARKVLNVCKGVCTTTEGRV